MFRPIATVLISIFASVVINGQVPVASPSPAQPSAVTQLDISPADLPSDPPPIAPDFSAPQRPLPPGDRVGVDPAKALSLTIDQAIEMALKNNNDIEASRKDVRIAEFNLKAARGIYDPILAAEGYYESRTTPTASAIGGAPDGKLTQNQFFGSAGVNGFTPNYGGSYTAGFNSARTNTSNLNALLNPQYPTNLTFEYVQPLFRNFRIDQNRRNIQIASKNVSLSDWQFRQRAIEVVAAVEQAYWDLAFGLRNLQVKLDAVRQARTQLESSKRLVDKGVSPPIDIVSGTAQITSLEQEVYLAQEAVTRAENTLKTLVLMDRTDEGWERPMTPISPLVLETPKIGIEVAVAEAIKNRPEIRQLITNREINDIDRRFFRDQTKPQIDLVGSYTAAGLAGVATPPRTTTPSALTTRVNELSTIAGLPPLPTTTTTTTVPENLVGNYLNSLGNLIAQDFPAYRVGVRISLPWNNSVAKANLARTITEGERLSNVRAQAEQLIEAEVRNALQAVRSSEARVASALAARQAAEQVYASEERLFRAGTSTFFMVLQRQNELIAARGRELQAQTDLNKAISEFHRATGTTLTANSVTVEDR